jgi:shikimate dehydrogenase
VSKAVIIGRPVEHARSPLIHRFWLKEYGLKGAYERREVMPGDVARTLRELQSLGYAGGNVTVPHKEEAFAACDNLSDRARIAGAVNTFWFAGDRLFGDNTDGLGFASHLSETWPDWDQRPANIRILGAGGGARGLIGPLLGRNVKSVSVANRSRARTEQLLSDLKGALPEASLSLVPWEERSHGLDDIDLLINTTSMGMMGQPPLEIELGAMKASAIVADIVYVPLETPLLFAASSAGMRTLDGLGMLLHQAVPGFEQWYGLRPKVSPALRAHILADLSKGA